jgi:CRISPR system Cascade subunit CasE
VHNVRPTEGGRGRRHGHVTVAQQTQWFHARAERAGFTLVDGSAGEPDLVVRARRTLRFDRRGRQVTLSTALFEGTLDVVDPQRLRSVLVAGIGPAKGYGCGLMTLAAAVRS